MAAGATAAPRPTHSRAFQLRRLRGNVLFALALLPFLIFAGFPVYWMFITTFKQVNDLYNLQENPLIFNLPPTMEEVSYLLEKTNYITWAMNTVEVGLVAVAITLLCCVPAAYVLARMRVPGSTSLGIGIFLTYLVPPTLLFLPLSQILVAYGLINSKWSLAIVYPTFTIPFCTWLLMGFFKSIPREITEAARVDGCSRFGALFRVILPVSVPGLLTVVIFAFTLVMQEYIYALVFVAPSDEKLVTIGVVTDLIRGDIFFWGPLMAGALIIAIPVAIVYNLFMDTFVRGITGGAIK